MDESLKVTTDRLKPRKQFGVPIGAFQSVQHRFIEMFVAFETSALCRSSPLWPRI